MVDGLRRGNRGKHFFNTPSGVCFFIGKIMKRFICIVCLLALLLSACTTVENKTTIPENNYTHGIYQLTFHTKAIFNDHVGNDWSFTYTCNGEEIISGHQVTSPFDQRCTLCIAVEV